MKIITLLIAALFFTACSTSSDVAKYCIVETSEETMVLVFAELVEKNNVSFLKGIKSSNYENYINPVKTDTDETIDTIETIPPPPPIVLIPINQIKEIKTFASESELMDYLDPSRDDGEEGLDLID